MVHFKDHLFDRKLAAIDAVVEAVLSGKSGGLPISLEEIDALMDDLSREKLIHDWHGNWEALGRYIPQWYVPDYDKDQAYLISFAAHFLPAISALICLKSKRKLAQVRMYLI